MKKILLLMMVVLMLNLTACGVEIEDTNGTDDHSLSTITQDNILNLDLGASGLSKTENESTIVKYSSKNFSGVEEIYLTNYVLASSVTLDMTSINIKEGNLGVYVIQDNEIVYEFALDESSENIVFEDVKGDFAVRIAGESASFSLYLDIY